MTTKPKVYKRYKCQGVYR